MLEDVTARLGSLGYIVSGADSFALGFLIDKVKNEIMRQCNLTEIPAGLHEAAVDMVAGEFLREMKAAGKLVGWDLEAPVKQISEGDTSVSYALGEGSLTPEQRLDALIVQLTTGNEGMFAAYRRITW